MPDHDAESEDLAYVPVVAATDVPASGIWPGTLNGIRILVCRSGETYHVVENLCSHTKVPLIRGKIKGDCIVCPVHGARFALADGRHLSPPASAGIRTFASRLKDGQIEVCPEPRDPPGGAQPRGTFF